MEYRSLISIYGSNLLDISGIWTCLEYGYSSTGITVTSNSSLELSLLFVFTLVEPIGRIYVNM